MLLQTEWGAVSGTEWSEGCEVGLFCWMKGWLGEVRLGLHGVLGIPHESFSFYMNCFIFFSDRVRVRFLP